MKKYLYLTLLSFIFISGCNMHNRIDFSSSDAFFSSLNEKEVEKKENKNNTSATDNLKKNIVKKTENKIIRKSPSLKLSSYKKQLKQKIGFDEIRILKIFSNPNLEIKHGKVKNLQFHLKFCHLDLFFLKKDGIYIFKHFDIRPSSMALNLNQKECVKDLNNNFILIRGPK